MTSALAVSRRSRPSEGGTASYYRQPVGRTLAIVVPFRPLVSYDPRRRRRRLGGLRVPALRRHRLGGAGARALPDPGRAGGGDRRLRRRPARGGGVAGRRVARRSPDPLSRGARRPAAAPCWSARPIPKSRSARIVLDYLLPLLAGGLADELGFNFSVMQAADPDGVLLNEPWFDEPYRPRRLPAAVYRPPSVDQFEWTFPVEYKGYAFTRPLPEAAAVMEVIHRGPLDLLHGTAQRELQRRLLLCLGRRPPAERRAHGVMAAAGLPPHRGEPEMPYARRSATASTALLPGRRLRVLPGERRPSRPRPERGDVERRLRRGGCGTASPWSAEAPLFTSPGSPTRPPRA